MGAESSEWVDVDNDDAEEFFNHNVDNDAKENHDHNLEEGLGRVSSTQHSGDHDLAPVRRRRGAVGECAVLSGQGAGRFTYKSKEYAIAGGLASIGNGGVMMTPHLLDYVTSADGSAIHRYKPIAWKTPLTSAQSGQIVPLMVALASRGTAYGYLPVVDDVGAKTVTAQTGTHLTDEWMNRFRSGQRSHNCSGRRHALSGHREDGCACCRTDNDVLGGRCVLDPVRPPGIGHFGHVSQVTSPTSYV